jgi:hypothetical protein
LILPPVKGKNVIEKTRGFKKERFLKKMRV